MLHKPIADTEVQENWKRNLDRDWDCGMVTPEACRIRLYQEGIQIQALMETEMKVAGEEEEWEGRGGGRQTRIGIGIGIGIKIETLPPYGLDDQNTSSHTHS